jgi:hypothetical protein
MNNIDTAYHDRQDLINNLSGGVESRHANHEVKTPSGREDSAQTNDQVSQGPTSSGSGSSAPPAQTLHDTWEAIEAQLDHWAEMDREYWRQRKEKEYATWLERTYGV